MSHIAITSLFENIVRKYFGPSFDTNEIENKKKINKYNKTKRINYIR